MSKEFKFVGVSRHPNGEMKVRYANDSARHKVLAKNGHTEMFFIELEQPEHKMDCVDALLDLIEDDPSALTHDAKIAVYKEAQELGFVIEATI